MSRKYRASQIIGAHIKCPYGRIRECVDLLDEEDRRRLRWSMIGPAVAIRGMRHRIEDEGFGVLNTWLLGEFLQVYLRKVGKLKE